QIRHALRALYEREGLLRLSDGVVRGGEVAQAHQLILGGEAVLEVDEQGDRGLRRALLGEAARLEECELRGGRGRGATEKIRGLHAEDTGAVRAGFRARDPPSGVE